MKTIFFTVAVATLFFGCYDHEKIKRDITYFEANGNLVCYHLVGGGFKSVGHPEDQTLVNNKTHILINGGSQVVDINLTKAPFSTSFCEPVAEGYTFQLDDGNYVLIDGKPKKLAN